MQIDGFTIILTGLFIRALLGILFLVFWLKDRRSVWFAWWGATFLFGDLAAAVFFVRGFVPAFFPIGIGVACLIAAFACGWQGARAFEGRAPTWLLPLAALAIWFAASLIPGFLENVDYRVILSSLLLAPLIAMTAVEFWRGRQEPLVSRWPIIVLFASLSLFFASRIALVGLLPFPFGALPMQPSWLGAFNLIILLHTIALAVLLVAMTKERLELEQQLKAQTDLLTGTLNRRALIAYGERSVARHRIAEEPLCLLSLDIDQFKPMNDRFGHSGGDEILTKFVAVVRDNIRPGDLLFRIGGDEFCCLLPNTNAAQAHQVAERVRTKVAAAGVEVAKTPVTVTVSLGIASTETFGHALELLMHHADMAVYAAKRQGRNAVVVASADEAAIARALQARTRLA
ncbi:MAG TPA: diguanylate cyclase [Xanthobacteraceae bacterium]|jgi:diguanylate cyclase (GGDEF)-like protein